jgi:hypothetical protein
MKLYAMKTCGNIVPPFSTSVFDEGEWSASRLGRFTAGKEPLKTVGEQHFIAHGTILRAQSPLRLKAERILTIVQYYI